MVLEVLVFMLSLNCTEDFESNYWEGFDSAMIDEWNIMTTTSCYQLDEFPSDFSDYRDLKEEAIIAAAVVAAQENNNNDDDVDDTDNNMMSSDIITIVHHPIDFTTYFDKLLLLSNHSTNDNDDSEERQKQQQVVFITQYSKAVFQIENAAGVSYPSENIAFVRSDLFYTTKSLSHEILHLVLEEEGYPKGCYIDKVHENHFKPSLGKVAKDDEDNDNNYMRSAYYYQIIARFDC